MDVSSLSYGIPLRSVKRGPQSVHVVKGYPERLPVPFMSRRHFSHTAVSAGIEAPLPLWSEGIIVNPEGPRYSDSVFSILSMRAKGGKLCIKTLSKSSPRSVSITTLDPSFLTYPDAPDTDAALNTAGLNPTPWTVPRMTIFICIGNVCVAINCCFQERRLHPHAGGRSLACANTVLSASRIPEGTST